MIWGWRETVLRLTGQIGPAEVSGAFSVPPHIGGVALVLGTEDAFCDWTITSYRDGAPLVQRTRTGPSSRSLIYVEAGAVVSASIRAVTGGHVDQRTGYPIPLSTPEPTLYARVYPQDASEVRPDLMPVDTFYLGTVGPGLIPDYQAGGLGVDATIGYVVGFARAMTFFLRPAGAGVITVRVYDAVSGSLMVEQNFGNSARPSKSSAPVTIPIGPWLYAVVNVDAAGTVTSGVIQHTRSQVT